VVRSGKRIEGERGKKKGQRVGDKKVNRRADKEKEAASAGNAGKRKSQRSIEFTNVVGIAHQCAQTIVTEIHCRGYTGTRSVGWLEQFACLGACVRIVPPTNGRIDGSTQRYHITHGIESRTLSALRNHDLTAGRSTALRNETYRPRDTRIDKSLSTTELSRCLNGQTLASGRGWSGETRSVKGTTDWIGALSARRAHVGSIDHSTGSTTGKNIFACTAATRIG
jgi:hypothetical protein